jgi:Tol biopolymer transport system component
MATLGGPPLPLAGDAHMWSLTVSPDGKQVAYITETGTDSQIVALDLDSGNRRILAHRPLSLNFWFIEWSPMPDTMAAVAIGKHDMGLVAIELSTGAIRDLSVSGWGAVGQPAWSPDGKTIFAPAVSEKPGSQFQIWAFDALTGTRRTLTSGSQAYSQWSLSATASGDLFAITVIPDFSIWVTDPAGSSRKIPAFRGEGDDSVTWVDGRVLTSNILEMTVHDLERQTLTRLRSHSMIYRQLAACGPGHVAYWAGNSEETGYIEIADISSGANRKLTDGPLDAFPACTADGSTLVFGHCTKSENRCDLIRKSLDSGASLVLTGFFGNGPDPNPLISPDGATVLMQRSVGADDPYEWAQVLPMTGGTPKKIKMPVAIDDVADLAWSPDGKALLYAENKDGVGNIWRMPLGDKRPKKLTAFDADLIYHFDVATDGRMAMSRGGYLSDVVRIRSNK